MSLAWLASKSARRCDQQPANDRWTDEGGGDDMASVAKDNSFMKFGKKVMERDTGIRMEG